MDVLSDSGVDIATMDEYAEGNLPLWSVAKRGLTKFITDAISVRKQDMNVLEPRSGNSVLHCAVSGNHPGILKTFLESTNVFIDGRYRTERTPLHIAALVGDIFAAKTLIENGADVNAKDYWGDSPLVLA